MTVHLALLLSLGAAQAEPAEDTCGVFSQEVYSAGNAWSGCELKRAGEEALWQAAHDHEVKKVVRLVFSSGRDSSFRFVTVVRLTDDKSYLITGGLDARFRQPRERWPRRRRAISTAEWDEINSLAAASRTFDHSIGTWDGDEIYMHCNNLSLEHASQEGYRFSSVSIGCNRPEKLAPLIDKVVKLANRKQMFAGWVPD